MRVFARIFKRVFHSIHLFLCSSLFAGQNCSPSLRSPFKVAEKISRSRPEIHLGFSNLEVMEEQVPEWWSGR
jgi:hypothetical protein